MVTGLGHLCEKPSAGSRSDWSRGPTAGLPEPHLRERGLSGWARPPRGWLLPGSCALALLTRADRHTGQTNMDRVGVN